VEFPNSNNSVHIGLCVGQLSASAVGLSTSVLELVSLGVEVFRLAIRLGSLVFTTAGDLEDDHDQAPWSFSVDNEFIERSELVFFIGALVNHPGEPNEGL
jgi:iron transport multicopper oxidase